MSAAHPQAESQAPPPCWPAGERLAPERVTVRLRERFGEAILEASQFQRQHWARVDAKDLVRVCEFLRDDPELRFLQCSDVTAVDWFRKRPRFEVVYNLLSPERGCRFRLKCLAAAKDPAVPSVVAVWPGANWLEREVYDLFGIRFSGHPDPRRILMPDDYKYFPLRKEFPVEGIEGEGTDRDEKPRG